MNRKTKIPNHVAIIMDGNGRWAKKRGLPRINGHREGANSVRAVLRACRQAGVKYLTLYAFSTENWIRPKQEVSGLMNLLVRFLKTEERELHANKIRLRAMGRLEDLPERVQKELARVAAATAAYTDGHLILALSYGGRTEIANATRQIAEKAKNGIIEIENINEQTVADHLYLQAVPDPDLMIRTSGEKRLSNFMLWQLSYAELYVTDTFWPDFREEQFMKAIEEYTNRQRRFGDIK